MENNQPLTAAEKEALTDLIDLSNQLQAALNHAQGAMKRAKVLSPMQFVAVRTDMSMVAEAARITLEGDDQ